MRGLLGLAPRHRVLRTNTRRIILPSYFLRRVILPEYGFQIADQPFAPQQFLNGFGFVNRWFCWYLGVSIYESCRMLFNVQAWMRAV